MLLAEANQWPSDVRAYFGEGDECHMCFHFPLMPRMFMAIRQEERHPIVEIMNQTPEPPDHCQWAIFLRNHDELTLEMVTDEERDYMYAQYAADPQMRLNLGIRRRLAPLMENSRVAHRADEQPAASRCRARRSSTTATRSAWATTSTSAIGTAFARRCSGAAIAMPASRATDPARLYFPVIMDPVYGYEAINVEAQERSPASLLQWMKRMIALRRQHTVFGRGTHRVHPHRQPQGADLRPPLRGADGAVHREPRTHRAAGERAAGAVRRTDAGGAARPDGVSTHHRSALLPDARAVWLLLVRLAGSVGARHGARRTVA